MIKMEQPQKVIYNDYAYRIKHIWSTKIKS